MSEDWTDQEIEFILHDYFTMLGKELAGVEFSKSVHRRNLMPMLKSRSEGSVEFKHQNISAVLAKMGQPFIRGYKPRYNYQKALETKVIQQLRHRQDLDQLFRRFAEEDVHEEILIQDIANVVVEAPVMESRAEDETANYVRRGIKTNYLLLEQINTRLGEAGERFAFEYEKQMLTKSGRGNLADQVEWVSNSQGDGLGFDILSRNRNGTDKYIEVKTTKLSKQSPFFFSYNEMQFSKEHPKTFHLYRVFDFKTNPKLFTLNGSLDTICNSRAEVFKGYF